MPGGDRTGPVGFGPLTGRGAGYCAGYGMPGSVNPVWGRGFFGRGRGGGGFGRGRGYRNMYWATGLPGWARYGFWPVGAGAYPLYGGPVTSTQEAEALKNQVKYMQGAVNALNERIKELENAPSEADET